MEAIQRAASGASYVVTTGTGSGKSLVLLHTLSSTRFSRERAAGGPRPDARHCHLSDERAGELTTGELVNSPQNAPGLVWDFARYTVRRFPTKSVKLSPNLPPDILLTNFMMLELLLTRQEPLDRQVI